MKKIESQLWGVLALIALPFYFISTAVESFGGLTIISTFLLIVAAIFLYTTLCDTRRKKELTLKYNDAEIVENIMRKRFWQGQTSEQLEDALGKPIDIDESVLRTKTKEIWKYRHKGGNRYGIRIILENKQVIGWDIKD
ncbi:MAG: DUF2845 domain-containing protein [Hyphomicrobiales bacterium]|nr:DUF2845 domain-containing protein [Hyphomicrobiales bacterium]